MQSPRHRPSVCRRLRLAVSHVARKLPCRLQPLGSCTPASAILKPQSSWDYRRAMAAGRLIICFCRTRPDWSAVARSRLLQAQAPAFLSWDAGITGFRQDLVPGLMMLCPGPPVLEAGDLASEMPGLGLPLVVSSLQILTIRGAPVSSTSLTSRSDGLCGVIIRRSSLIDRLELDLAQPRPCRPPVKIDLTRFRIIRT